jgi:hypothetical protein
VPFLNASGSMLPPCAGHAESFPRESPTLPPCMADGTHVVSERPRVTLCCCSRPTKRQAAGGRRRGPMLPDEPGRDEQMEASPSVN